jgi:hypothetical protein
MFIGAIVVIIALAISSEAQDPFVVAPQAYKLQFENEWVRVVRVHYAPFEKLPTHDHPKGLSVFIYLNDGGPVRFKHVEGSSGTYPAVRPPTKAGAYRLAGFQQENHEVENLSELPSDFLQVELKTEAIDPKSFRGRNYPDQNLNQGKGNYHKVEFENDQIRITRLVCAARGASDPLELTTPALLVALSPLQFKADSKDSFKLDLGQTRWLEAGKRRQWLNLSPTPAHHLLIEFKSKPAAR